MTWCCGSHCARITSLAAKARRATISPITTRNSQLCRGALLSSGETTSKEAGSYKAAREKRLSHWRFSRLQFLLWVVPARPQPGRSVNVSLLDEDFFRPFLIDWQKRNDQKSRRDGEQDDR